ncbi:MAG: hypothetical protein PHI40_05375, partial [Caldisericia bacterium]|nr:hypothetical protein [Caldisericia bacterium]
NGTAAAPAFSFSADTNNGMFRATTDALGFSTAGTERIRIAANGVINITGLTASRLVATDASKNLVNTITLANTIASISDVSGSTGSTNLVLSASPTLTGTLTAAAATFSGTVAFNGGTTGSTPPFTVDSTYVVTNLNADLWDGYQFASYLNQAVLTTSSPTFAGLNLTDRTYTLKDNVRIFENVASFYN